MYSINFDKVNVIYFNFLNVEIDFPSAVSPSFPISSFYPKYKVKFSMLRYYSIKDPSLETNESSSLLKPNSIDNSFIATNYD